VAANQTSRNSSEVSSEHMGFWIQNFMFFQQCCENRMTFRTVYGHVSVVSATNVSVCEQESEFA
jgi:hypothetical protein